MATFHSRVGAARAKLSDWLKPEHVYPRLPSDFEPTTPSYDVALTAHQTLLELSRQHPDDADLMVHAEQARKLRDDIWNSLYGDDPTETA